MQQQEKLSNTHEGMPADQKAELRAWRLNGSMARASIVGLNSTLLLLCHVRGHGGFLRCVCVCVCVFCVEKKNSWLAATAARRYAVFRSSSLLLYIKIFTHIFDAGWQRRQGGGQGVPSPSLGWWLGLDLQPWSFGFCSRGLWKTVLYCYCAMYGVPQRVSLVSSTGFLCGFQPT